MALDLQFVVRIHVGEQKANGEGIRWNSGRPLPDVLAQFLQRGGREGLDHVALCVDPFVDPHTIPAEDKRFRLSPLQIVFIAPVDALDKRDVLEPGRGDKDDPGALALDDGVCRHRRAVDDAVDLPRLNAAFLQNARERPHRRIRSGWALRNPHGPVPGQCDKVRKRPSCIDPDGR